MTMQKKAFVLLSGGLDSTTTLYLAAKQFAPEGVEYYHTAGMYADSEKLIEVGWVEAISIDYGQRHLKEAECAAKICKRMGIKHSILHIGGILDGKGVMLTNADIEVPNISYSEIKGVSPTYVPFRNGTMLAIITAIAQKYVMEQIDFEAKQIYARQMAIDDGMSPITEMDAKNAATQKAKDLVGIYAGMHADDAFQWAYPDCTFEFLGAMANAIYLGTYNTIRLIAPFVNATKGEIVTKGDQMGVPFEDTWSCYRGEEKHCGRCPTCRSRKDAFVEAGVPDPTEYAA